MLDKYCFKIINLKATFFLKKMVLRKRHTIRLKSQHLSNTQRRVGRTKR